MGEFEDRETLRGRLKWLLWDHEGTHSGQTILRQTLVGIVLQSVAAVLLILGEWLGILPFNATTPAFPIFLGIAMIMLILVARSGRVVVIGREILWRGVEFVVLFGSSVVLLWIVQAAVGT